MIGLAVAVLVGLATWTGLRSSARRSAALAGQATWTGLRSSARRSATAGPRTAISLQQVAGLRGAPGLGYTAGRRRERRLGVCAAVAVAAVIVLLGAPGLVSVVVGAVAAGTFARWRVRRRGDGDRERRAAVSALRVVVSEMGAGRTPREALAVAARDADHAAVRSELTCVVAFGQWGGDEGALLARARVGAPWLSQLGACLVVCVQAGAPAATAIEGLARRADQGEQHRQEVAAALAGPRAQARILAALPVAGALLGTAVGGSPVRLLGTPAGAALLLVGLGLQFAGLAWMRWLTERALAQLP